MIVMTVVRELETLWTSVAHLVDTVADNEHVQTFVFLLTTLFLHERDDDCTRVVVVTLVWIDHFDAVLRIRPECL